MAFDITNASNYVALNSKAISVKAVTESKFAKLLQDSGNIQFGVKGSAAILKMDADVNLQSGAACGRSALGSTILSDKTLTVTKLNDFQNFCPATLDNKFFSFAAKTGASPENGFTPEFAQSIMDYRAAKIAEVNEQILFQGNTSLTGSTNNLKSFDGILKQTTGGTYVNIGSVTGSTIVEKLQNAYLAMPIAVRQQADFRLFVGQDVFDEYTIALAAKNIYKATDDFKLFGANVALEVVNGLNATRKVVAARLSAFQLGLDGTGDADNAVMRYSVETNQIYIDFQYALGIAVVYGEQVGIATV